MCFLYGGKIQKFARCQISYPMEPHFPRKMDHCYDLSQEIFGYVKTSDNVWFENQKVCFAFFPEKTRECFASCLISKWSGSYQFNRKRIQKVYFESKKSMVIAWIASNGNINSQIFFRAITGYPLISTFMDWFPSKILDYQGKRKHMQIFQKGMNTR